MPFFNTVVPDDFSNSERLDKYISSLKDGMNRSKLKSSATEILVNGKTAKLSSKVKARDEISIQWDENIPTDIIPEDIPLHIIFEDFAFHQFLIYFLIHYYLNVILVI